MPDSSERQVMSAPATTATEDHIDVVGLTVTAALGECGDAVVAWNELTTVIAFTELPHVVVRAMPQIYLNVKDQSVDVQHFNLLKGVYRSSWSMNALRFAGAREVFTSFDAANISYRVIKGGALCALAGNWAVRRMGDLDIVIDTVDEARTVQLMRTLGFRPRADQFEFVDAIWENDQGVLLDLHTIRGKPPLFQALFSEDGLRRSVTNTDIRIPSPEVLLCIAAWHDKKGTASTDHVQALLDVGMLIPKVDLERVRSLLLKSHLLSIGVALSAELARLGLVSTDACDELSRRRAADLMGRFAAGMRHFGRSIRRVMTLPFVVRHRRPSRSQRNALKGTSGRAFLYRGWVIFGQLRPLEQLVCERFGGFALDSWDGGPIAEVDYRIRIPAQKGLPARLRIRVTYDRQGDAGVARALFINGILHGFLPLPEDAAGTYELVPKTDFIEISLRTLRVTPSAAVLDCDAAWQTMNGDSTATA